MERNQFTKMMSLNKNERLTTGLLKLQMRKDKLMVIPFHTHCVQCRLDDLIIMTTLKLPQLGELQKQGDLSDLATQFIRFLTITVLAGFLISKANIHLVSDRSHLACSSELRPFNYFVYQTVISFFSFVAVSV